MNDGHVEPMTRVLGLAGLLPQALAAGLVASGDPYGLGHVLAFGYGALIISFIGGIWWGFAMNRQGNQSELAMMAVVPSLACLALLCGSAAMLPNSWALVMLGSAIMLTLLVDRHLEQAGDAPHGWLAFRRPLSLSLGALTILAGVLS